MDIGKSIAFVAEDEKWVSKLGIGALISYIPVINFAWNGYLVEIIRNVSNEDPRPLPGWEDLGDKFMRGLIVSVALIIYFMPALVVACMAFSATIIPAFFPDSQVFEELAVAAGGLLVVAACCVVLYAGALSFLAPAVFINYARQGTFASTFHLGEIIGVITRKPGDYLLAWLVTLGVGFVISVVISVIWTIASVIPCVGWILALPASGIVSAWGGAIYAHLFGQVGS